MKAVHLTWLMSNAGGGIPPVVAAQARALAARGVATRIAGVADPRAPSVAVEVAPGVPEALYPARGPLALGLAPGLGRDLAAAGDDLLHLHGLFTWPSHAARAFGRRTGRPVVVAPHGMLEPWALSRSAWKKRAFRALVEDDNLRRAAGFQALNVAEARHVRALGLTNPIAVVPNGVDLPDEAARPAREALQRRFPALGGGRTLLFLGRLHPKKGLPLLVEAWARLARDGRLERDGWTLLVAGPDQLGHEAEVKRLAEARALGGRVLFAGPLYGEAKAEALAGSDAFVLPSYSEGFSMAVLEAMAWRLPVVVTRACHLDVAALGAGHLADADAPSLTAALRAVVEASAAERSAQGARGRAAVEQAYTWPAVAAALAAVYAWLLGGGAPPSSVEVLR